MPDFALSTHPVDSLWEGSFLADTMANQASSPAASSVPGPAASDSTPAPTPDTAPEPSAPPVLTLVEPLVDDDRDPDPSRAAETAALAAVQRRLAVPPVVATSRAMSLFGEHAAGWLAAGLLGAAVDRPRRRDWLTAAAGVAVAHGASIAVKRVIRRPRPDDESVQVLAHTPSRLSFPSSHASSTTAAAVVYGGLLGSRLPAAVVPPMLVSRLVLGVHFPSDVLAGSVLGATVGGVTRRLIARRLINSRAVQKGRS